MRSAEGLRRAWGTRAEASAAYHPLLHTLFKEPVLDIKDGYLAVPEGPGIGVELNEELVPPVNS